MLEVTDLVYSYSARNAVQQANFTIHKGECLGLLGPNGAGKTTTISCIVGLLGEFTYWAMTGFQNMLWNQLAWHDAKVLQALAWQYCWASVLTVAAIIFSDATTVAANADTKNLAA